MVELLAPAGDFETAEMALYSGADAVYCATQRYGARAYAKNLTIAELQKLLIIAHCLKKKIYVTVNTIIKQEELKDAIEYLHSLYNLGVDGLILADFGLIDYTLKNLPQIEVHVSTQVGIKDLDDVKFFEKIGVKRVVLARELTLEEIAYIRKNTKVEIEVFVHGALCVAYSGGCLMSSYQSLRSGNRGRCSQNCRRIYQIYKDDQPLGPAGYHLSMKDLNTSSLIKELVDLGVDSLKIEGRMKNKEYVYNVVKAYRDALSNNKISGLEQVFHRPYTAGFIASSDRGSVVDPTKKGNEGSYLGKVKRQTKDLTAIETIAQLSVGDRIKIAPDYYFTVDKLYDAKLQKINQGKGLLYFEVYGQVAVGADIFKMVDSTISIDIALEDKYPLVFTVSGSEGKPLKICCQIDDEHFEVQSDEILAKALAQPLDQQSLERQLGKLGDTPYRLAKLNNKLNSSVFMNLANINATRRKLVEKIDRYFLKSREEKEINIDQCSFSKIKSKPYLVAFCTTAQQYEVCLKENISVIYFKNYIPYVNANYENFAQSYALAGGYGAIMQFYDKDLTADYSFNVLNAKACQGLRLEGFRYVTLSLEASLSDIKAIFKAYESPSELEMVVYGRATLMTLKYCPLRRYKECSSCHEHNYTIADEKEKFPILAKDCYTQILNSRPLNLIDDLNEISKYLSRFRLQFTTEDAFETAKIIKEFKEKLANIDAKSSYFDPQTQTRGYYHRLIK